MKPQDFECERCGGHRKILIVKGMVSIVWGISCILIAFYSLGFVSIPLWLICVIVLLALVSGTMVVRVRCLNCEPEWKSKMWGGQ